ncbi:hypothetical protein [Arthrobacter flavus]|uniref:Uncharacterized protein n=1 Tax=Arthrobacter flavus TaxID=95172 RepID=A0ABW4Q9W8_9MICC
MYLQIPEDLDLRLDRIVVASHVSKHALLLEGAQLVVARHDRQREIAEGMSFVASHDAALLTSLEDA